MTHGIHIRNKHQNAYVVIEKKNPIATFYSNNTNLIILEALKGSFGSLIIIISKMLISLLIKETHCHVLFQHRQPNHSRSLWRFAWKAYNYNLLNSNHPWCSWLQTSVWYFQHINLSPILNLKCCVMKHIPNQTDIWLAEAFQKEI